MFEFMLSYNKGMQYSCIANDIEEAVRMLKNTFENPTNIRVIFQTPYCENCNE